MKEQDMNTYKPMCYVKQLPTPFCDIASNDFLQYEAQDGSMGADGENEKKTQRDSTVRFIDAGHWFSYLMLGVALEANKNCQWNYEINNNDNLQFAEYGINQHYDWHTDNFPLGFQTLDRKISVVCLLSDVSEFEGGDFELKFFSELPQKVPLTKGSVVAFPSNLPHRVSPVTKGLRRSATMWLTGPCFK